MSDLTLKNEIAELKAELAEVSQSYHELIYAVEQRYPGESRHKTALRYIREAEQRGAESPPQQNKEKDQIRKKEE